MLRINMQSFLTWCSNRLILKLCYGNFRGGLSRFLFSRSQTPGSLAIPVLINLSYKPSTPSCLLRKLPVAPMGTVPFLVINATIHAGKPRSPGVTSLDRFSSPLHEQVGGITRQSGWTEQTASTRAGLSFLSPMLSFGSAGKPPQP